MLELVGLVFRESNMARELVLVSMQGLDQAQTAQVLLGCKTSAVLQAKRGSCL
jgi:hypothetical protein